MAALCLLVLGCGGESTSHGLSRTRPTDDTLELRGTWTYRSFEVDVDLGLVTRSGPDGCLSTGSLTVNDALSAPAHYNLPPTACSDLELTDGGDIVLHGAATGHDWTADELSVDTDAEEIALGPVTVTDSDGNLASYRFTLSAPACPDASGCKCGVLRRSAGGQMLELSLGRRC